VFPAGAPEAALGLFEPSGGDVVGGAGLHRTLGLDGCTVSYWLATAYLGQGYATEVAAALTRVAFEHHGVGRVEIHVDAENVRSAAVARRLGFRLVGTRQRLIDTGERRLVERPIEIHRLTGVTYPGSPCAAAPLSAFDRRGARLLPPDRRAQPAGDCGCGGVGPWRAPRPPSEARRTPGRRPRRTRVVEPRIRRQQVAEAEEREQASDGRARSDQQHPSPAGPAIGPEHGAEARQVDELEPPQVEHERRRSRCMDRRVHAGTTARRRGRGRPPVGRRHHVSRSAERTENGMTVSWTAT
jgi:hypothetical protein